MKKDYENLIYSINDEASARIYSGKEFLNLLDKIKLLKNDYEIISIDMYHHYQNNKMYFYGYDMDGGIYRINRNFQVAELIDVFGIMKKINTKEKE